MRTLIFTAAFLLAILPLCGNETIRRVQEELRRRQIYFGDIDGRATRELAGALQYYQMRKGLEPTGDITHQTLRLLGVKPAPPLPEMPEPWPDVVVLRSDAATEKRPRPEKNPDEAIQPLKPEPIAEATPEASAPVGREELQHFIEQYLEDSEAPDLNRELRHYAGAVDYFDHGVVHKNFVRKDVARYYKRWPHREYELVEPVQMVPLPEKEKVLAIFTIDFQVKNKRHEVSGRTANYFQVSAKNDDLKLTSLKEKRLAENSP